MREHRKEKHKYISSKGLQVDVIETLVDARKVRSENSPLSSTGRHHSTDYNICLYAAISSVDCPTINDNIIIFLSMHKKIFLIFFTKEKG
jgi:hypothetical protein